ncbi:ComEC/Rec2 family competence protein [Aneurinibacillus aneurinilyticus]|uniref:Metallo-beta-lactamase domain protein n=2 Tax=Aneurinibacillus aneurinilyticus TaxID=1391 RepID=U1WY81_ANEAE|nr:ComEC/Rec2 family competence protein [Aneurinibacillus aneurinilyticus]ERI07213.1 metallo-beta-lactamase domain protein [Aneurinibacillus aneurinilyticus ATCC 12856]MED0730361.1 ComEC/Rec2 family competence protein [Aneurinibacillus aneurinilyticus]MED0739190.1 ComEC/Rec2 family competence protein [Aneurinibacillus aneurinilyticus]
MKKWRGILSKLFIIVSLIGMLTGCNTIADATITSKPAQAVSHGKMTVKYIDVGQGDATLIVSPEGKNVLIDAGDKSHGETVTKSLQKEGVKQIDYFVLTHPDSDHIGGATHVIDTLPIKSIVMPLKSSSTETYFGVLLAIKEKNIPIIHGEKGMSLDIGKSVKAQILSPGPKVSYIDTNDWSIVLKVTYGKQKFLFTGDAAKKAENDMLASGQDLSANVYKAGHHGSKTSSSTKFLKAVRPEIVVISVGANNKYHHPNIETLQHIHQVGVKKIYRTDDRGTVTATTDGNTIEWKSEK